jgi:hypothetical protein
MHNSERIYRYACRRPFMKISIYGIILQGGLHRSLCQGFPHCMGALTHQGRRGLPHRQKIIESGKEPAKFLPGGFFLAIVDGRQKSKHLAIPTDSMRKVSRQEACGVPMSGIRRFSQAVKFLTLLTWWAGY